MPRPPKLTPEIQNRIVTAISTGNTRKTAAAYAGIGERTLYTWLARKSGPYEQFRQAIEKAEADAEVANVTLIRQAATSGTWTAAAWWLERMRPADFGRKDRVKLEVDQAALAQIADVINRVVTDPDTLDALRAELSRLSLEE